jgi:hypothetical protein
MSHQGSSTPKLWPPSAGCGPLPWLLVADADAVVQAVEARADPQALADAAEVQPQVGVLQAFATAA